MNIDTKIQAWADIREAADTKRILTAYAIGIEKKQQGNEVVDCLKIDYQGIYGYIPKSVVESYELKGFQMYIGTEVEFCVTTAIRDEHASTGIFLANRVKALQIKAAEFRKTAKVDDIYTAFITGVHPGRIYLHVEGVPASLTREFVSYSYIQDLTEYFEIGDTIDVKINKYAKGETLEEDQLQVDGRINEIDPWINAVNYQEGGHYLGIIKRIHPEHGFFIELADTPGLIVRSNIPAYSGNVVYQVGDEIRVRLTNIDIKGRMIKAHAYTVNKRKKSDFLLKKAYAK